MSYSNAPYRDHAENNRRHVYDYRHRKTAKGFCIYGGCWELAVNAQYCEQHRIQSCEQQRKQRRRKKEGSGG